MRRTACAVPSVQLFRQRVTASTTAPCCAAMASRQPSISSASFFAGMATRTGRKSPRSVSDLDN
jgi:hypothetical protein